jgi:hypothetical protein
MLYWLIICAIFNLHNDTQKSTIKAALCAT